MTIYPSSFKNMRSFNFLTLGVVLNELNAEIQESQDGKGKISRPTFYRLEYKLNLPRGRKTAGGWRTYTREQIEEIKKRIKENYNIPI